MPQMVLQRDFVLNTLLGHSIAFEKGVPVGVPPKVVPLALQIGAELVEAEEKEEFLPETKATAAAPNSDDREAALITAFRKFEDVAQTDPVKGADLFNASGKPKFKPLSAEVGFKVDAIEIAGLWAQYQEMKAAAKE
jgi:hypothetical protein